MTAAPLVLELIDQFASLSPASPWNIPGHAYFRGTKERDSHLVLAFLTHGNECGSLPAAVRLLRELCVGAFVPRGPTSLLLGNLEAARADVRFVDEDYNRVFTFDHPAASLERRRAEQVRPLLDEADFFLDFHQTQTPTQSAFWTFPFGVELALWARAIAAAPLALTRAPGGAFAPGRKCLDEYVRDRGKIGLTLELGTRGFHPVQEENCYQAARRAVDLVDEVSQGAVLAELAATKPPISWFRTAEVIATRSEADRLRPGLGCWSQVTQGELLSADGAPELRAPQSGRVLFPKYPVQGQTLPPELLHLAVPVDDPEALFG